MIKETYVDRFGNKNCRCGHRVFQEEEKYNVVKCWNCDKNLKREEIEIAAPTLQKNKDPTLAQEG